jgi:hypothetical protein
MTTAFVLGNGTSRRTIELNNLRKYGKIYGCNALYRDFAPDVLIATDPGISTEIQNSGYALQHEFYTRSPLPNKGAERIQYNFGYSSGPIAISYASMENCDPIYLLGFDFSGINGRFNNLYADTTHYKRSDMPETYFGNWVDQVRTIIAAHKNRQYIRVVLSNAFIPPIFAQLSNLKHLPLEQFVDSHK